MRRTILIGFVVSTLAASFAANAQQYTVVNLGTLGGSALSATLPSSAGYGINASGQVTGWALTTVNVEPQAFISDATTYALTGLGVAGINSEGYAVNASGQVAGYYYVSSDFNNPQHAFVTVASTNALVDLGTLACGTRNYCNATSQATSINTSGQVVGYSQIATGPTHAFITDPSTNAMTDLGTLGGGTSEAFGINDSGQVTGASSVVADVWLHAFITDPTTNTMTDLGTLGGPQSWGTAINASGQVAGYSYTSSFSFTNGGPYHAFVTDATTQAMTDIGTLGGAASEGLAVNASGQVVGWANTAAGAQDGFLYTGGQMLDLNSLLDASDAATYTISSATAINDSGQIVANGTDVATGQIVALLLNPVAN